MVYKPSKKLESFQMDIWCSHSILKPVEFDPGAMNAYYKIKKNKITLSVANLFLTKKNLKSRFLGVHMFLI